MVHSDKRDYLNIGIILLVGFLLLMLYATNRRILDTPPIYRPWLDSPLPVIIELQQKLNY